MNTTIVIATLSREALNQMVIGTLATMIAGSLFFFLGALFGWYLWRNAKAENVHYTSENKRLVIGFREKKNLFVRLKERLDEVLSKPDSE